MSANDETENHHSTRCNTSVPITVIMLSGWMQSGKDTVGDYLCASFGFRRFAFADVLKDEVATTYNIPRSHLDDQELKSRIHFSSGLKVREILIRHGQERRQQDADYWINKVIDNIEEATNQEEFPRNKIVITDWRFPNEYATMKKYLDKNHDDVLFGWRINRWKEAPLVDPTEISLDAFPFDRVFANFGTIEELQAQIRETMYSIGDDNVRIFLTDVDDVLLRWLDAFRAYLEKNGFDTDGEHPLSWNMASWIKGRTGQADPEINRLVLDFNHSSDFGHLIPCNGAQKALANIKRMGFHVVAISSCTDNAQAVELRKNNLRNCFGNSIDHVICLPLGSCKKTTLAKFPPSIWVDDNPENVLAGVEFGHHGFVMKRPWNGLNDMKDDRFNDLPIFQDWKDVETYLMMQNCFESSL